MPIEGKVAELIYLEGQTAARIICPPRLIPAPGRYLLAQAAGSDSPLPVPVFARRSLPDGFLSASPAAEGWSPGTRLHLRGPLGRGFSVPASARRLALVAFDGAATRLLSLLDMAFAQDASVVLVCDRPPEDLPLPVEVQPLKGLTEVSRWADYMAMDAPRRLLPELISRPELSDPAKVRFEAQVLVEAPMPCGGLAQCGACAVELRHGYKLTCEDGPVFDLKELR